MMSNVMHYTRQTDRPAVTTTGDVLLSVSIIPLTDKQQRERRRTRQLCL